MQISSTTHLSFENEEALILRSIIESFFDYQSQLNIGEQSGRCALAHELLHRLPNPPQKDLLGHFLETELKAKNFTNGDMVRIFRERAGLTQVQLANRIDTYASTIDNFEKDKLNLGANDFLVIALMQELGIPKESFTWSADETNH